MEIKTLDKARVGIMTKDHFNADRWVKFGKWVQERRQSLRSKVSGKLLSQGEAARSAGMSRVHWGRIETGDTGVKETTIPNIARALNLITDDEIRDLYRRAGFLIESEHVSLPPSLKHFTELPEELQKQIAQQVDTYYKLLQVENARPSKETGRLNKGK